MQTVTPEQIEDAAQKRGLSISQLSRMANVDDMTFRRWRAGKTSPSIATVQKFLDVLNRISPDEKDAAAQ